MDIERTDYQGDDNIGFYATVTDEYIIMPRDFKEKEFFSGTKVETRVAGTRLVGLFTAGNSNCLLLPDTVKDREKQKIEDAGVPVHVVSDNETALGNLILANDQGAVISERLEDQKEEIEEALEVDVEVAEIAGIPNPGVCGVANNYGALIHRDASEEEAEVVKEALGTGGVDIGTINMGSPYISSGVLLNNEGILIGRDTTGPEVGRIDRTLIPKE